LSAYRSDARILDTTVTTDGAYPGVRLRRRVIFSRTGGYLIVEDRIRSTSDRRFSQLWHLRERSRPTITGRGIVRARPRGDLTIVQLAGGSSRIVTGATAPIQGWVSYRFNERSKAPVVITTKEGRKARFITLVVPSESGSDVRVGGFDRTAGGWNVTVEVDGQRETMRVSRDEAVVERCGPSEPLDGQPSEGSGSPSVRPVTEPCDGLAGALP
jgi:hypothetical protein